MDREKEIERIADIMYNTDITDRMIEFSKNALDRLKCGDKSNTNAELYKNKLQAEALFNNGYRKADEVRKEVLRDIDKIAAQCGLDEFRAIQLRKYAKQLGVEVDE